MARWAFGVRRVLSDAVVSRQIHHLVSSRPPPPPPVPLPAAAPPPQPSGLSAGWTTQARSPPPPPPVPEQVLPGSQGSASEAGPAYPGSLRSPEELLDLLRQDGIPRGLQQHWDTVQLLHEQEAFTVAQVAWIFDQCRHAPSLKRMGKRGDENELPLGNRIVQLFTHFVCARIPELTADEMTCFVEALTSQALPMDEFWLFMMAKQIQDTPDRFSPSQIATISRCYADKGLEDDEFFTALSARVARGLQQFPLSELASFLFACAKIRFLDEGLCEKAFPLFEEAQRVVHLDGPSLSAAITAAALLDWLRAEEDHKQSRSTRFT
ncbi:unnamed protein product [Symbiodinium natans]|uniref:Uncharacterized protein n=1 Tax=Symbiodinium natans TaxID=878477 RepID=A0A812JXR9_9DINO|nr:unnamed protein product [Symbiodinium natans]